MSQAALIRILDSSDTEDYRAIRLSALQTAPEALGSVHGIEAAMPIEVHAARLTSSVVFGAYADGRIVGMVGLRRAGGPKQDHKAFVWGFYVAPDQRRCGVGSALLSALMAEARGVVEQLTLTVVTDNAAARALYQRFGFTSYGVEPRALKNGTSYSDEVLMVLFF